MIMAVEGLLRAEPRPSEAEVRDYLSGNLCRCGTYSAVIAAVASIVAELAEDERSGDHAVALGASEGS
jgi:aerobic-type carbon monoxide dehydrogenase small subunit (CoxS/CutS family)